MATVTDTSTYDAAHAFLYARINYERAAIPAYRVQNFKLERMRDLLNRLGDPDIGLPIIHVAGTKGKGSTSSALASILTAAGYRTGLYTSPHLERTEERLVVDGEICSPHEFVEVLGRVRPAVDAMDEEGSRSTGPGGPTYFEVMTAMALVHFARRRVDAVVLEVGLGGRLDSTNVVTPQVAVITSISFDHMKQLGNTLAEIAGEKAGIIKPGVPVVTGVAEAEPLAVIERTAREAHAPLVRIGRDFHYEYLSAGVDPLDRLPRGRMEYRGRTPLNDLQLGLLGRHQAANAAVTLATVEQLEERGWKIGEAAVRRGLAGVRCPARIEVLRTSPTVVLDTAHNGASIAALTDVLAQSGPFGRRELLFACSRDKDPYGMLTQLWPHFDVILLTRFLNNPRSVSPEELSHIAARVAEQTGERRHVITAPDPAAAWKSACAQARPDDLICITGSFFLAAELRAIVRGATER